MDSTQLTGENTTDFDASGALETDRDELLATTFYGQGVRLLHQSSSTFFDLPSLVRPFVIGKRSNTFKPDLDLRDLPQSEFISRSHAQLSFQPNQFYIEDLGSKNGTVINGTPLPVGQPQPLAFGDQLCFGNAEALTFIFMKDQPINLEHLQMLSEQDRSFEVELLTSYVQSVASLLDRLAQVMTHRDFVEAKLLASQVAISSYNVGADVMNLLAKQMEDQARQKSTAICKKTLAALQDGLAQVHQFMKAFYDI
jgi:HPt (histidine-containing phosphotransfer) domain-containing protein